MLRPLVRLLNQSQDPASRGFLISQKIPEPLLRRAADESLPPTVAPQGNSANRSACVLGSNAVVFSKAVSPPTGKRVVIPRAVVRAVLRKDHELPVGDADRQAIERDHGSNRGCRNNETCDRENDEQFFHAQSGSS